MLNSDCFSKNSRRNFFSFHYHSDSVFYLAQFIRLKKPYQLMMAIAMPASLLIYIQPESRTLFYTIGLLVALDLLLALVISLIQRFRHPQEKKSDQQQEAEAK